jgi:hypothetical protein
MSDEFNTGEFPPSLSNEKKPPLIPIEYEHVNPWIGILYKPRAAVRTVLESTAKRDVWLIPAMGVLFGIIAICLAVGVDYLTSDTLTLDTEIESIFIIPIILVCIPIYYFMLLVSIYLLGWFYAFTGRWLSGHGTASDLRAAYVWSFVPGLHLGALLLLPYLMFVAFGPDPDQIQETPGLLFVGFFVVLYLCVCVWFMILHSKCIGEAHRFSAWRGLGTYVLANILLQVLVLAIYFVIILLFITAGILIRGFA